MGQPLLSVVVPVHNGQSQLPRCLDGLRLSEYSNFEVIVVDDCSADRTPQIVLQSGAQYIRTASKLGPAGARNVGAQKANGTIIVFVDADVVLPPSALALINEDFECDPELAALFGSYCDAPAWQDFFSQYKNLMHHYIHQNSNEHAVTFWAGCGAVRKDIFQKVGGFDSEKYRVPSIEDIEFGYRLVRAGYSIRLDKRIEVKHLKRWRLRDLIRADIFYRAIPWTQLIMETRNLPRDLNLNTGARVSAVLISLLLVLLLLMPFFLHGSATWISSRLLVTAVVTLLALLLALNRRIYIFFWRKRGGGFMARAILAHWFYYLYSFAAFLICAAHYRIRSLFFTTGRPVRRSDAATPRIQGF